jgi:5-methylcytosine-specific restriction protein A
MTKRMKPLPQPWKPKRKAQSGRKTDDSKKYQTARWRKFRKWYVSENPLCVKCLERDLTVAMQELDHIKPIRLGGEMYDIENLQSLCKSCHGRKSATERNL